MADKRIEIRFDSEEGFKNGMKKLMNQISYLSSMRLEIDNLITKLYETEAMAISEYCNGTKDLQSMAYYIPEHLTKKVN